MRYFIGLCFFMGYLLYLFSLMYLGTVFFIVGVTGLVLLRLVTSR